MRDIHRRRLSQRRAYLKKKYGLSLEDYQQMLDAQGGVCAVCGNSPKTRSLNVDHDHRTGLIRGLLCILCNKRVIWRHHDSVVLRKAVEYIERKMALGLPGPRHVTNLKAANSRGGW